MISSSSNWSLIFLIPRPALCKVCFSMADGICTDTCLPGRQTEQSRFVPEEFSCFWIENWSLWVEKPHSLLANSFSWRSSPCASRCHTSATVIGDPGAAFFEVSASCTQSNTISNRRYTQSFYLLVVHRHNCHRNGSFLSEVSYERFKIKLFQNVLIFHAEKDEEMRERGQLHSGGFQSSPDLLRIL